MTFNVTRLNDGSGHSPRLRLQHSLWGLSGLPLGGPEWTLEDKLDRVKGHGFEAVECWLTAENEEAIRHLLVKADLRLALGHHPFTLDDSIRCIDQARRLGADYVFAQPCDAFTSTVDAAALLRDARACATSSGVPYFVETHRNTITETLPATEDLIRHLSEITFTADLSHYFVSGEFYGWESERLPERLGPILERTVSIHGRISNGEQIQVDVGDGKGRLAQAYVEIWAIAMRSFLASARPGDIFPFTPELGPPAYAITHPDGSGEISDRWTQSLVMADLAKQAWTIAEKG